MSTGPLPSIALELLKIRLEQVTALYRIPNAYANPWVLRMNQGLRVQASIDTRSLLVLFERLKQRRVR